MYRSHYDIKERPFEISTDTSFLWMGEKHKEALAMLKYGVLARKGFLLLTGDVGTGKTTLVNALMESLNETTLVANITDPLLEPIDFFNFIAASFGMKERFDNKVDFLLRFAEFLRQENAAGKNVLLILDEAHRFSKDLLEQFRLLSNIELPEKKLINMFLVGQNEFNRTLMSTDCRALRQRITLTYNIKPLSEAETLEYIRHRLKVAGTEAEIFHRKAVGEVYRFSQGYPRLINIICDHALLTGFVRQAKKITPTIIKECSQELRLMGDTIRVSSSDFFDGTDPASPSPPPETLPADAAALAVNVPGRVNAEVHTRQPSEPKPQGVGAAEPSETTSNREPRPGVVHHKEPGSRYWVMAACIALIALVSALLFQQDWLSGTAEIDRTASATTAPAQGQEPETITLTPAEPLAVVKRDGKLAPAKRSPYEQAQEQINKGNLDQAVKLLEDSIEETPTDQTNKEAYFELGKLYTKAKRYPEAIRAYRKAAELDDRSADTFFNLGFVYSANGDYRSAEQMFQRVAALRPPYLDKALFNLAAVQCKQDKRQQCIESLEEALAENPNNQRARTYLSQVKLHAKGSR